MKKIIVVLAIALISISANAQIQIKAGLTGGTPAGEMQTISYYNGVAGIEVSALYFLTDQLGVGIDAGFLHYFNKNWDEPQYYLSYSNVNFNCIPIRGVIEYYLTKTPIKPMVGLEFGLYNTSLSYDYKVYDSYYGYNIHYSYKNSAGRFGIAPFVGGSFDLGGIMAIECVLKYTSISDIDDNSPKQVAKYITGNVGVVFKF
jgi:hypothetical protein